MEHPLIEIWERGMFGLLQIHKDHFLRNPLELMGMVAKYESVRGCLLLVYQMQVNKKKILTPIEDLAKEEKTGFWVEAKKIATSGDTKYLTDVCKCLHVLGNSI